MREDKRAVAIRVYLEAAQEGGDEIDEASVRRLDYICQLFEKS